MDPAVNRSRSALLIAVLTALGPVTAGLTGAGSAGASPAPTSAPRTASSPSYLPPVGHVFVINLENKGYDETWGPGSAAPYLSQTLRSQGVLLSSYYGTAHNSQPNYVAQVS